MHLTPLVREARLRAGLTQAELAVRAGVQQPAIARWEAGRARPRWSTVAKLVRACGLEVRVALTEPDPGEVSLIERNLLLSPTMRLDQLVTTVAFIRAGREGMAGAAPRV